MGKHRILEVNIKLEILLSKIIIFPGLVTKRNPKINRNQLFCVEENVQISFLQYYLFKGKFKATVRKLDGILNAKPFVL